MMIVAKIGKTGFIFKSDKKGNRIGDSQNISVECRYYSGVTYLYVENSAKAYGIDVGDYVYYSDDDVEGRSKTYLVDSLGKDCFLVK